MRYTENGIGSLFISQHKFLLNFLYNMTNRLGELQISFCLALAKGLHGSGKLNSVLARWREPNAGWPGGWTEAYLALDFFGSFCIKTKRT